MSNPISYLVMNWSQIDQELFEIAHDSNRDHSVSEQPNLPLRLIFVTYQSSNNAELLDRRLKR